ncbi:hypothetical protein BJ138DRAFT_206591 [Hygrophoropsis aurantiaca]|uniref:Uncharacterized protein n=1 Tax=Hygrophoropsis aurantiaca TaxID=72124 RepID=A0ACB8A8L2_9AGAM|nr:hypothetical protein BJ138DRAFT_206591 [Hygrophoropsis aurantiaca]
MPSTMVQSGPHCPTFDLIRNLVIFGDSYCDVDYKRTSPRPTQEEPLGVKFPGVPFVEDGKPNWIGHLLNMDISSPRKLVYNFATGGDRVPGVGLQIENRFLCMDGVGTKPNWLSSQWSETDTLFVTWVGINDLVLLHRFLRMAEQGLEQTITLLFGYQEDLYKAGARNFLFFDIPPIYRCPWFQGSKPVKQSLIVQWNEILMNKARSFANEHPDITVLVFSSWDTFTRVLDDPVTAMFDVDDPSKKGGIWFDELHPTSKMHEIIARDLYSFLSVLSVANPM